MRLAVALGPVYGVWGSPYFAIAVANRTLPPLLMLSVRFLIAGGLLYARTAWRGDPAAERPGKRQRTAAAVLGGPPPGRARGRAPAAERPAPPWAAAPPAPAR